MQAELREDSKTFAARLREAHSVSEEYEDIATGSVLQVSISNLRSHAKACLFLSEFLTGGHSSHCPLIVGQRDCYRVFPELTSVLLWLNF